MPPLSPAALRKQIASGETGPLYVLVGDDDAETAAVAGEFADVVDEGLRPFNVERFYGGETKVDGLLDVANTLPMMAPRRIVLVLEAEKLLIPRRDSEAAQQALARLEDFLKAPSPYATVVFVCGALDLRRRVVKLLLKEAQVVNTGTVEDRAGAELWVKTRAARDRINLDSGAVRALVDRAGFDIVRLRSGLERVALYAMEQPTVTADDVKHVVSAGPQAQEDFGIANAIRDGDAGGALRQLAASLDSGAVPYMVLGQLRWVAEKLPPHRLRAGIEAVFRTDVALKSSGGDPRILLERLVVELCGDVGRAGRLKPAPTYDPGSRGGRL
jgi:DNA polymerase-3 subunit delta